MIVIICCIHCNCILPVCKLFCVFYRFAGVKRLRTTVLKCHCHRNSFDLTTFWMYRFCWRRKHANYFTNHITETGQATSNYFKKLQHLCKNSNVKKITKWQTQLFGERHDNLSAVVFCFLYLHCYFCVDRIQRHIVMATHPALLGCTSTFGIFHFPNYDKVINVDFRSLQ